MALKTTVIVNGINNLSDARYCAGMGAEMMGFNLDGSVAGHLTPDAFKEISGWVSGVKLVGEFVKTSTEEINSLASELNLDYVQLNKQYLIDELEEIEKPVIIRAHFNKDTIESELIAEMELYKNAVAYFLVYSYDYTTIDETNIDFLGDLAKNYNVIIGFGIDKTNLNMVLEKINPAGIGLQGGHEIKPGLKTFDELEEIFELLEV